MPGYLAFDRDAVDVLRLALELALYELSSTIGRDSAAASARARAQQAARSAEAWIPTLRGLVGCMTLEGYSPVRLDSSDLAQAYFFQLAGGRSIVTDPFNRDLGLDEIVRAEALARALGSGQLSQFDSPEEQKWLIGELVEIGRSPETSAAFMRVLGPKKFERLSDVLSSPLRVHALLVDLGQHQWPPPELAVLQALGLVLGQFKPSIPDDAIAVWADALDDISPFALVLMAQAGVDIPGAWTNDEITHIASQALIPLDPATSEEPVDALLGAQAIWLLSQRPVVARQFLESAERDLVAQALLHYSTEARNALLNASQSLGPKAFDPDQIAASMQRVIDILVDEGAGLGWYYPGAPMSPSLPTMLGEYFAPYLPELFGEPSLRTLGGGRASGWAATLTNPSIGALFALLYQDPAIEAAHQQWAWETFTAALANGDTELIEAAAFVIGAQNDVAGSMIIDQVEAARANVEQAWAVAGYLPVVGTVLGGANEMLGGETIDRFGLGIRDAIAKGEVDESNLSVLLKWSALQNWLVRHPSVERPPALSAQDRDDVKVGENAGMNERAFEAELKTWMIDQGLSDTQQAEINNQLNAVGSGAGKADGFRA